MKVFRLTFYLLLIVNFIACKPGDEAGGETSSSVAKNKSSKEEAKTSSEEDASGWTAISKEDAPSARQTVFALWTGETGNENTENKMLIFGGYNGSSVENTGTFFDLESKAWGSDTAITDAPTRQFNHAEPSGAVCWTGDTGNASSEYKMIIWGGHDGASEVNTGKVYDPANDSWRTMSATNAPSVREGNVQVCAGGKLFVWGGVLGSPCCTYYADGAVYDVALDTWTPMSTINAPTARRYATAVYTGNEIIFFGGDSNGTYYQDGKVYDVTNDSWSNMSAVNSPDNVRQPRSVWTGTEMIVWGGMDSAGNFLGSGASYNPSSDSWTTIASTSPQKNSNGGGGTIVLWTGDDMLVYEDDRVASYNPNTNKWKQHETPDSSLGLAERYFGAVWTGTHLLIWGGYDGSSAVLNTGASFKLYD